VSDLAAEASHLFLLHSGNAEATAAVDRSVEELSAEPIVGGFFEFDDEDETSDQMIDLVIEELYRD